MSEFPPKCWQDIFAYDDDDVVAGFREYRLGEPEPGPNRPAGYRWGWANRKRDTTREPDAFDEVRRSYMAAVPGLIPTHH